MIQTMMALWNRGTSGRLLVMFATFFCLCISISLLFVTVGSVWGSLLAHGGRPAGDPQRPVSNAVVVKATAPPTVTSTTAPVEVTPTLPPNLCLASPTEAHGNSARVDATANNGRRSGPARTATSRPLHRTPTPGATMLPTPSPTLTVTIPPAATPTATTTPGSTPTVTPTGTSVPGTTPTPTVVLTPTDTPTPGATPTATPPGSGTDTPTVTATGTVTPVTTATVPAGSPTVVVSATPGVGGRQGHDGRPQIPGDANNGQPGQVNCLGDALVTGGETNLLVRLQDFIWVILVSSLLGTALFCAQVYRLSRKGQTPRL